MWHERGKGTSSTRAGMMRGVDVGGFSRGSCNPASTTRLEKA